MRAVNDQPGLQDGPRGPDDEDDIDFEPATEDTADAADSRWKTDAATGITQGSPQEDGDRIATSQLRWRLAAVAGFLSLFHLAFALVKVTGPAAVLTTSSDAGVDAAAAGGGGRACVCPPPVTAEAQPAACAARGGWALWL